MGCAGRYDGIHGKMKKRSGIKVRKPHLRAAIVSIRIEQRSLRGNRDRSMPG